MACNYVDTVYIYPPTLELGKGSLYGHAGGMIVEMNGKTSADFNNVHSNHILVPDIS